jgi:hypothetical protein
MGIQVTHTRARRPLRFDQPRGPGFLFGVTEYDDGVTFGNVTRPANYANKLDPYRDFVVVQPPGSIVLLL